MPFTSMVPTVRLPPAIPFTLQFTAVLVVPVTVAVKAFTWPTPIVAEVGAMLTVTGTTMVTIEDAVTVGSTTLVAVTVTVAGLGTVAGAK